MSETRGAADGPIITMRDVVKTYERGGVPLRVLDGLDLDVAPGEFLALMGPSGSGKSTILNLIGGLDDAEEGSVVVAGTDLSTLGSQALADWRARNVGFVFQAFNLIPVLTALENVELPLLLAPLGRAQRREQARYALELVGLEDRMDHRPKQLSGGQEQRVAIARAMAMDPTILLCDEPTGDLDRHTAEEILNLMRTLNQQQKKTIIMVTHDPNAAKYAHRTFYLQKGVFSEVHT